MTEKRFRCTACGLCCRGWLPLTLVDALTHAGRFPLAVVWTPVKRGAKAFDLTARIGLTLRLRDKTSVAVRIAPTAYLPPAMPCSALTPDNLCALQDHKPSRCRTMPFFPYAEERDQTEYLIPRAGWTCDTSSTAPVVYGDRMVISRDDFDRERAELMEQAPLLRGYAEALMSRMPALADHLAQAVKKPGGGHVALSFASLLRHLTEVDRVAIAQAQRSVLLDYESRVADRPDLALYRKNYGDWAWELERYSSSAESQ